MASKIATSTENNIHPHATWVRMFYTDKSSAGRLTIARRWLLHCVDSHRNPQHFNLQSGIPYDIGMWGSLFRASSAGAKPALAARWLSDYLQHIRDTKTPTTSLHEHIASNTRLMRSMVLAIPADSDVLRPDLDFNGRIKVETAASWMRNFVDIANPLFESTPGIDSPHMALLREVWLAPKQPDRLAALHKMATVAKTGGYVLSRRCVRAIVWAAVQKNGFAPADVALATKLTLSYYKNAQEEDYTDSCPLDIAIGVIMATCDAGQYSGPYKMTTQAARRTIMRYPSATATLLRHAVDHAPFNRCVREVVCQEDGTSLREGVTTWLPEHRAAILCAEQLGLTLIEVLDQVTQSLQQDASPDLPLDILGDMAP